MSAGAPTNGRPDPRVVPAPEDPMELVGVGMPARREDLEEMARCFIEEYALMGYPRDRILFFFSSPFYAGSFHLTRTLGRETIERLLAETVSAGGA